MTGKQHDSHCTLTAFHRQWRVTRLAYPLLVLRCACDCGLTTEIELEGLNLTPYCDRAAMNLQAEIFRKERGALPVSAGSEAWN